MVLPSRLTPTGWSIFPSLRMTDIVRIGPATILETPLGSLQRRRGPPPFALLSAERCYATPRQKGKLIFTGSDVPPLKFWESMVPTQKAHGLTGRDCLETAKIYCSVATVGAGSTWKGQLKRDYNIDPYTLHYVGTRLLSSEPGPAWRLGLHMLATASDLEYSPSTLSLVMLLLKTPPENAKKTLEMKMFREAQLRFIRLVREGTDPDALTLNGIWLAGKGEYDAALQHFKKAIQAYEKSSAVMAAVPATLEFAAHAKDPSQKDGKGYAQRPVRWNWEPSCYVQMGRILLRSNKLLEAEEAFRVAAQELDIPSACYELAELLPRGSPEKDCFLITAAMSGDTKACRELGMQELEQAREPGLAREKADERRKRSAEWFSLAGAEEMAREARTV